MLSFKSPSILIQNAKCTLFESFNEGTTQAHKQCIVSTNLELDFGCLVPRNWYSRDHFAMLISEPPILGDHVVTRFIFNHDHNRQAWLTQYLMSF
jgi:hypothetical protein